MSAAAPARALFLFGRDLRLEDHAGLAALAGCGEIVPALVEPAAGGAATTSRRRAARDASVAALAADLERAGAPLVVRTGPPEPTVIRLVREARASTVGWSLAYDAPTLARQRALQCTLEEAGIAVRAAHDAPAVAPEESAAARVSDGGLGYRAFAPYLAAWRRIVVPPVASRPRFAHGHGLAGDAAPAPSGPLANSRAAFDGYLASAALAYATARDVPGDGPTARLSTALGLGTLGPRAVRAAVADRARDPFLLAEERASLAALERSLAMRDFFLQLAWFFEDAPDAPLQRRMRRFPAASDHPALEAWRAGRTGFPLVDAGLRQLAATGWMHPRARLVAASFLCFDLGVDWRVGRDAWDAELEEYDPAVAAGNWQWIAGVGADLAQFPRIYSPRKQARAYDPVGAYARRWIAELADRPAAPGAGEPAARRRQLDLPLFGDRAYPAPVVDHEAAARAYLRRYAAFARGQAAAPTSAP